MAKKTTYKTTLNDMDRFYIDHNLDMSPRQLLEKFEKCSNGDKVPSLETIENYRNKYKDMGTTTTTNARSTMIRKGTATVMSQAASEQSDVIRTSTKQPPWVTRIYGDK